MFASSLPLVRPRVLFAVGGLWVISFLPVQAAGKPADPGNRLPFVAVMPITGAGIEASALQVVTDGLSDELVKTGKVRVMERSQMENILKEQGFQQSGACDGSECAVEIGKLLSIDKMVVGSLGKIGSSWSLSVRAVDVGSGEVVGASRRMQRGDIDEVVSDLLPTVATELSGSLHLGIAAAAKARPASVVVPAAPDVAASKPVESAPVGKPDTASEGKSGSRWGWWVAGGAALAGGVAAAVLLSGSETASASASPSVPATNGPWTTTVEW